MNTFSNGVRILRLQRSGFQGAAAFGISLIMLGALLGRPGEGQTASPSGDVADFLLAVGGALAGATGTGDGARALAGAAAGAFIMSGPGCFGKASPTSMWCGPLMMRKPLLSSAFNTYLGAPKTCPQQPTDACWYGPDAGGYWFAVRWIGTYDPNGTYPLDCAAGPPGGPRYYAIFSSTSAINPCGPYGGGYYGSQAGMDYLWRQFRGICGVNPSAATQSDADAWTRCDNWSNVKPPLDSTIRAQPTWQALLTTGVERPQRIIAIDAGHTPQCPFGTVGPTTGSREVDNVQDIAQKVIANLRTRGYQPIATRPDPGPDAVCGTERSSRVRNADRNHANIFISIHNNSAAFTGPPTSPCRMVNPNLSPPNNVVDTCAHGTEVWFDPRPPRIDPQNTGVLAGNSLALARRLVASQTIDLVPPLASNGSGMGGYLEPGIKLSNGLPLPSARPSTLPPPPYNTATYGDNQNFEVLWRIRDLVPPFPAVIDEVAFLSNVSGEETKLSSADFRASVATVIASAIVRYFGPP
jgi:N-acetylmuramoyl-L-alanine amidase